ncbi:alpha/beta fold hydrolase [Streptomyces sp. Ag109_O5-10]|uniref:alpha/beta fold hydrolase n=1 Tax=Streptomyces sp. Ag109_O5-10 TaxID=1855349 RepID=UPI00089AD272|nr:alpha/beta hydrolase [Streptomyces sp. Ag109_O5-10]SEF15805.1 Pimeloyl-ACP methyl ester carboxylesterase [Streptomyces sp. Ag109_O5-10]
MTTNRTVQVYPDLPLSLTEAGSGRPVLVLHGGGGPATVAGLAARLAGSARTLAPVHPGWDGTPRPDWLTGVDDLAVAYLHLLQDAELNDVLVIGSSLGGRLAAEMAIRDTAGVISGLVLINAVGADIEGEPVTDFFALDPRAQAEHSWHDPDRFYVDPATLPATELARRQANMATMRLLTDGGRMSDPKLLPRLGRVRQPVLLIWGESDRIVTPAYGAAYAKAFPQGRFEPVPGAGHLPHLERPEVTAELIEAELRSTGTPPAPAG